MLAENMRWNHLPVAGGLYDQHPQLLEEWRYIFEQKAIKQDKDRKADEAKNRSRQRSGRKGH